jgi:hypothetical protein
MWDGPIGSTPVLVVCGSVSAKVVALNSVTGANTGHYQFRHHRFTSQRAKAGWSSTRWRSIVDQDAAASMALESPDDPETN